MNKKSEERLLTREEILRAMFNPRSAESAALDKTINDKPFTNDLLGSIISMGGGFLGLNAKPSAAMSRVGQYLGMPPVSQTHQPQQAGLAALLSTLQNGSVGSQDVNQILRGIRE